PAGIRPPSVEAFKDIVSEWPELGVYAKKVAEVEREAVGKYKSGLHTEPSGVGGHGEVGVVTAPATSEAARWDGWGTALKPAIEPIILARKPLDGTVANNVLAHGVGGLNIDACRVSVSEDDDIHAKNPHTKGGFGHSGAEVYGKSAVAEAYDPSAGRFPANVLLDEHAAAEMDKQSGVLDPGGQSQKASDRIPDSSSYVLKRVAGTPRYQDRGGASRYFPVFKYQAKAPKKERPVIEREAVYGLRDDLTEDQVDYVLARLREAGVETG